MSDAYPLRSYGRTKARTLKPRQAALIEALLPHLAVPEGEIDLEALFCASPPPGGAAGEAGRAIGRGTGSALSAPLAAALDLLPPAPCSQGRGGFVLEIGFGGGEHLVAQAGAHPEQRFIGAEPFINGVGSCLRHIEESGVQNVRVHHGDARALMARLPGASLDRVDILFPDPWPKTRHWKRRLIQRDFVGELARLLAPAGEVRFATDWANYAAWTLEMFHNEPRFAWTAERAEDWRKGWLGHVTTRYEEKRLGDCAPVFLAFKRVAP